MEPYQTLQPDAGHRLPNTEILTRTVLALPTGTAVGEAEIAVIGRIFETAMFRTAEVKAALEAQHA
jgi:hypothetical protein